MPSEIRNSSPYLPKEKTPRMGRLFFGGEGGIRTLGTFYRTPVFKTGTINHSVTSPYQFLIPFAEPSDGQKRYRQSHRFAHQLAHWIKNKLYPIDCTSRLTFKSNLSYQRWCVFSRGCRAITAIMTFEAPALRSTFVAYSSVDPVV